MFLTQTLKETEVRTNADVRKGSKILQPLQHLFVLNAQQLTPTLSLEMIMDANANKDSNCQLRQISVKTVVGRETSYLIGAQQKEGVFVE